MKEYPRYKDSCIRWIGKIPINWKLIRLKWLVKEKLKYGANEAAELEDPELPRYIRITDFDEKGNLRSDTWKSLPYSLAKEYLLEEGDILFARSGATVGKTFQFKGFEGNACFAGYLIKASLLNDRISSDFLDYYTKSNSYENWKNRTFIQSTIQNISAEKYQNLEIPLAPINEQKIIVDFLNEKNGKIDKLLEEKQKMVTLLQEERAAIIERAVTKGLNSNASMIDSGIEWLGKIPEHWEMKKLKCICYMKGRIGWQGLRQSEFTDNGPYLITGMNFKDGVIRWDEVYHITEERYNQAPEIQLKLHDVLMTKDGTIGKLLYVDYLPRKTSLNSHLLVLRPLKNDFIPKYLYYTLNSQPFKVHIETHKTGTTFFGITQEAVGLFKIILPPINEQREIVEFIEKETNRIDETTFKIAKEIELLEEYKTALISEAVTGKIDVRNEV